MAKVLLINGCVTVEGDMDALFSVKKLNRNVERDIPDYAPPEGQHVAVAYACSGWQSVNCDLAGMNDRGRL